MHPSSQTPCIQSPCVAGPQAHAHALLWVMYLTAMPMHIVGLERAGQGAPPVGCQVCECWPTELDCWRATWRILPVASISKVGVSAAEVSDFIQNNTDFEGPILYIIIRIFRTVSLYVKYCTIGLFTVELRILAEKCWQHWGVVIYTYRVGDNKIAENSTLQTIMCPCSLVHTCRRPGAPANAKHIPVWVYGNQLSLTASPMAYSPH